VRKYKDEFGWAVHYHLTYPASDHSFSKFYTVHLNDDGYDSEAHNLLLNAVSLRSGIQFHRMDGSSPEKPQVGYVAPHLSRISEWLPNE
jgi:hypothetical protein